MAGTIAGRATCCIFCTPASLPTRRQNALPNLLSQRSCKQTSRRSVAAARAEAQTDKVAQAQAVLPQIPQKRERYQRDLSQTDKNRWRKASQQLGKAITVVTIGRAGITENTLISLGDALAGNEVVKARL